MKDLEGRVAVVAGATRGAGRSATNFFSENGVPVAAMCAESHQYRPPIDLIGGRCSSVTGLTVNLGRAPYVMDGQSLVDVVMHNVASEQHAVTAVRHGRILRGPSGPTWS